MAQIHSSQANAAEPSDRKRVITFAIGLGLVSLGLIVGGLPGIVLAGSGGVSLALTRKKH